MTRSYLRLDPCFDDKKAHYPDGPFAALIATLCLAEHQPQRGRFRSAAYLRALLGKRGRHVPFLMGHGDLVSQDDGRLYLDGWDEWQEGDWKVAERVERIRNRQRNGPRNGDGNGNGNGSPLGVGVSGGGGNSGGEAPKPPPSGGYGSRANGTSPRQLADRAKLAQLAELDERRRASRAIHNRYLGGEISQDEEQRLYADLDKEPDDLTRSVAS